MDRSKVLDQTKLVPDDNVMSPVPCYVYLQDVIEEGIRSTFGMRQKDAMILRLASDLRSALDSASKTDELERKIKGLQLENGRLKKRIEADKATMDADGRQIAELQDHIRLLEKEREQDKATNTEDRADTGPTA